MGEGVSQGLHKSKRQILANHTLKMCLAYKAVIFFSPRQIGHRKVSLCLIDKKGDLNFKKLRGDKLNHTIHIRNQRDLIKKKAS